MPGLWLLIALALTLPGVPGGRAQPQSAELEVTKEAGHPSLEELLRKAETLLLLGEELQSLRTDLGLGDAESLALQGDRLSKRQHPGKREEKAEEVEEKDEQEREILGPQKRQHPGRREDEASWSAAITQHKRQHPGRRSSWLGYTAPKRQNPSRGLVDPKAQRSRGQEEEEEDLMPGKRQHPGRRALGSPCGSWEACEEAVFLLGLLGDLSRGQGTEGKQHHPGQWAA
ncbi:thyrotropin releasing hormone [Rhynchocyon petersi]